MSPIDDELRSALHRRATALAPSPDPLAGIEGRARRMRRTRAAAAVAGSALAVAAVAVVVPALTAGPVPVPGVVATTPSAGPEQVRPSYALDPSAPWAYRGEQLPQGLVDTLARDLEARSGRPTRVEPLYGATYEPSGRFELVYLAVAGQERRWGLARTSEAGPDVVLEAALPSPALSLAAALPGDEGVARLLVVASPEVTVEYGPDAASEFAPMTARQSGVAVTALVGDLATDTYRLVGPDGQEVERADAPEPAEPSPGPVTEPANLLDWAPRGELTAGPSEGALLDAFAEGVQVDRATASYRPLFTGSTDAGVRFTYGQAWSAGGPAHTVGLATGGTSGDQFFLGPVTADDPQVLAFVLCCEPGSTTETLVVVPVPGTGQVLYDDDATGELRPVGAGQDGLDGVVLVDRDPRAQADRLQTLDGDGDLDAPLFEGDVFSLLCGLKGCG